VLDVSRKRNPLPLRAVLAGLLHVRIVGDFEYDPTVPALRGMNLRVPSNMSLYSRMAS
jgi:hypothetical protein